ncbi:UDP-4-amino-4,6-dideoxy-N-acetyl-beta-L-altrosamine N-acetyltransferase [Paenibacillus sp. HWE-109]|uniref:UDP-4-amino-4, 6-dideoxy-N-acetyl-beta-L-altrosamine N-acetyltransferase n=1 Tax=Paenibacillus sp. HWE-109 TaxID=1306526 RepID=UPI001EDFF7F2|nr:UDP-4-amino-4,6-dideoxy-N-acetyl-beta-L-altrosamine N-acetyltransferase [Paenibacillus sp. HWE-109]UKS26149.1 UDP-4-amino-4,6-dideoxy-N-acetyl-beta-L-altrosamine N-acetyltransferase [Paenibacillus sp. HWE-109]
MNPFNSYRIRPMLEDDLAMVLQWRNSDRVRTNMYSEELISWEIHCTWFSRIQKSDSIKYYVLEHIDKPIGVVNFTDIDRINGMCNWGFYIGDNEAPRGSGTALGFLGLVEAFEHLHIRKVCAEVIAFNDASLRFHRKLGFTQEGKLFRHVWKNNKYEDIVLFACFSDQWAALKEKLLIAYS